MSTPYCFVTVQTGARRVDLTLPTAVPVVELTPAIARLCGVDPADHPAPAWTLARVGAAGLDLGATLAKSDILDGDVLHLVEASRWRGPTVVDVADTVAQVLESAAPRWSAASRSWLLAGLGAAYLVVAAVVMALGRGGPDWTLPAAFVAAALIGGPLALPQYISGTPVRIACAIGSVTFGALAGWSAAGTASVAAAVTGTAAGVALAALGLLQTLPVVAPALALVATLLAGSAAAVTAGARPVQAAAAVAVLGVLALRALPRRLARHLGGRVAGRDAEAIESTARRSLRLLSSLTAGVCMCILGAVLVLAAAGGGGRGAAGAEALAAGTAIALGLRARTFRFLPEILPPAITAGVALLAIETALGTRLLHDRAVSIVLLLGTGIAFMLLAARREIVRRPAGPAVGILTRLVDAALLPLALATMGVFGLIIHVAQGLGH